MFALLHFSFISTLQHLQVWAYRPMKASTILCSEYRNSIKIELSCLWFISERVSAVPVIFFKYCDVYYHPYVDIRTCWFQRWLSCWSSLAPWGIMLYLHLTFLCLSIRSVQFSSRQAARFYHQLLTSRAAPLSSCLCCHEAIKVGTQDGPFHLS